MLHLHGKYESLHLNAVTNGPYNRSVMTAILDIMQISFFWLI